jgi:excisionase family DNA binding protein
MQTNERLRKLLEATPEQLRAIDAALSGQPKLERPSMRLLRMVDAANETGLSRTTLWRAINEGRLDVVEVRKGSRRIPEASLRKFVGATS